MKAELSNLLMKEDTVKNHFLTKLEDGVLLYKNYVFYSF